MTRRATFEEIVTAVAAASGHHRDEFMAPRRCRRLAPLRWVVARMARAGKRSLAEIARRMGGLDHTTVIYYLRRSQSEIERGTSRGRRAAALQEAAEARLGRRPLPTLPTPAEPQPAASLAQVRASPAVRHTHRHGHINRFGEIICEAWPSR
jgi:hypothetical protein